MIRAVGFDLDGTLFDHCGAASAGLATLLQERDWVYEGMANLGQEWIRIERGYFADYVAGNLTIGEQRRMRMRDFLAMANVEVRDAELDELVKSYLSHYANSWIAYPDVRPTLDRLRNSGFRLAVLTNGQQEQQEAKLVRMGIRDMFESVLAIGTLSVPKPDAKAFMELSLILGSEPWEVAYVGDDPHGDAIAATNAGLHGVWLNREGQETPEGVETEINSLALFSTSGKR
ncbi:MAG: HAD family hydrolase [Candidatus Nanopelagicaceae bacterium]|nr:HAD family hydrolase [Candidatus Nanopelagicaceae bacterium]